MGLYRPNMEDIILVSKEHEEMALLFQPHIHRPQSSISVPTSPDIFLHFDVIVMSRGHVVSSPASGSFCLSLCLLSTPTSSPLVVSTSAGSCY